MVEITTPEELRDWFENKPRDWAQIVAVRAAMRALPFIEGAGGSWLATFALLLLRANVIAWSARSCPENDFVHAAAIAATAVTDATAVTFPAVRNTFADVNNFAAFAANSTNRIDAAEAARAARAAVYAVTDDAAAAAADAANSGYILTATFWECVQADCQWLQSNQKLANAAQQLSGHSLWYGSPPDKIGSLWQQLQQKLLAIDDSYAIWIEWFDRRIAGEVAGFDIPGDKDRQEDQQILMRLAEASNDDFWNKGAAYVNTTLQLWLDEARARVVPSPEEPLPEAPAQDSSATAYGVNSEGKIDRLPTIIQQHLHDVRNQRQIYADVRDAFGELRAQGQRLGETLTDALDRMMRSMPDAFEDAQAYLVWRDGNRLRRLYLAHRSVALANDPDPARLESAIAEQLGGALDLFNLFARNDDGLRAKDEATIPFQERAIAETEAALVKPVVAAMLAAPAILTDAALGDLQASIDDDDLPSDDPYAAQTRVLTNTTWRNIIASVIDFGRAHYRTLTFAGAGAVATGFLGEAGGSIFTDLMGTTQVYAPIMNFIIANAPAIKAYAVTAYSNGAVGVIVDAIVHRYKSID